MLTPAYVELLNQIGPLSSIEPSNDIECLVVEGYGGVEVPPCVETGDLCPCVTSYIIDFTFVHRLTWEGAADRVDLRAAPADED